MANTTFEKHVQRGGLGRYAGKWVALVDEKVVTMADTLQELDKRLAKAKSQKEPVYFLVPRKDEGPYILA